MVDELTGYGDLGFGWLAEGDADGIADAIHEQGADADGAFDASIFVVAGLGDAEVAHRLATVPQALTRREDLARLPLRIRTLSSAMEAAERLISLAEQDAADATQQRDAAERAELLAMLGIAEGERVAPTLRAQVRRLEEQQKRRARRIQTDTLIRAVADIQTVLRDALTLQLGAQAPLLNEYLREPLQEYAARTSPAQTLSDVQAVETTLRRLRTNANARLALEALMSRFVR